MKLWFKYSAGIFFGLALFAVSPQALLDEGGAVAFLADLAIRMGQYVLTFLLFINLALAILKLYEEKKFWRLTAASLGTQCLGLAVATIAGIAVALVFTPVRIPLMADIAAPAPSPDIGREIMEIFPESISTVFAGGNFRVIPAFAFALVIGLAMAHDPLAARPVSNLLDSVSRILHTINTFITEILAVLLIPVSARGFFLARSALTDGIYSSFFLLAAVSALVVLFVILPGMLYLFGGKKNPFPVLYSSLAATLAGAISGNVGFAAGTALRAGRENLGIKRRYNSIMLPVGLLFGRIGTAFIASMAFVIILSSYSPLTLTVGNLLLMALLIPVATILSSSSFASGPSIVLAITCALFGRGFENGYLIMTPIAFVLSIVATALDIAWISASYALVSGKLVASEIKSPRHFI